MTRPYSDARRWSPERRAAYAEFMRTRGGRKRQIAVRSFGRAYVPLTKGAWALIDESDIPLVQDRSWHLHGGGYGVTRIKGTDGRYQSVFLHQRILPVPEGMQVDHINGNRLDNRRVNLRPATIRQQRGNQISRPGSASPYRGVTWDSNGRGGWAARVGKKHLGRFPTQEEAARVVDRELIQQFGEFARLNFPEVL